MLRLLKNDGGKRAQRWRLAPASCVSGVPRADCQSCRDLLGKQHGASTRSDARQEN